MSGDTLQLLLNEHGAFREVLPHGSYSLGPLASQATFHKVSMRKSASASMFTDA